MFARAPKLCNLGFALPSDVCCAGAVMRGAGAQIIVPCRGYSALFPAGPGILRVLTGGGRNDSATRCVC